MHADSPLITLQGTVTNVWRAPATIALVTNAKKNIKPNPNPNPNPYPFTTMDKGPNDNPQSYSDIIAGSIVARANVGSPLWHHSF